MIASPVVGTEVFGKHVLVITIDRPQARNSINDAVAEQLAGPWNGSTRPRPCESPC
ncbi:hypothetical protein [Aeromicrobium sp. UC242_57]|uniref:hypothetical protein n=1 Tax=Aeromicrobium sp. UC242_57 TaxID=3374624 RepID=UPI0037ABF01A